MAKQQRPLQTWTAWVQVLSKKTQNITTKGIWDAFCAGSRSYDCVASFTSAYQPTHWPACPNWIAHGVATTNMAVDRHVQYFSSKGLSSFLRMAEKHSEVDKAWELKLSKKYNDLAGGGGQAIWKFEDTKRPAVWEAAYPDQNTPHAFTGLLQSFQYPMGDCNHEILCTVMPNMFLCERRACKYNISSPGRPMIHKLDIHSGGKNVVTEDLAGSPVARRLQNLSCSIVSHVSSVACGANIDKFMQLLPDSSPVLLGCDCLRTDATKAFTINSVANQPSRRLQQSRSRSFARLVAGAQLPEARSMLSRADLEEPLNVSDDGQTFTCAITGDEAPIQEGHKVTIKQLLEWQACQVEPAHEDSDLVPMVIQRAVPGLDSTQFQFLRDRTHFLLSWAYVQEKPAVQLLRTSLEEFDGPEERKKVSERFALKRQLRELQRLGMPLPRGARQVLHSNTGATARPNTCPAGETWTHLHVNVPLQPLHTGAWLREDIDKSTLMSGPRRTSQAPGRPVVQQLAGARTAKIEADNPPPDFFRPASATTAAVERIAMVASGGLTWRAISPLVSGIPRPAPERSPAAAGAAPQSSTQCRTRQGCADDIMSPQQHWQLRQHGECYWDVMDTAPDSPELNIGSRSMSRAGVDFWVMPGTDKDPAQASVFGEEHILGQLGKESKHLAEMSKELLKRAADLLGHTEAFEQALEQAASLGSDLQGVNSSASKVDTQAEPTALTDEHELTHDEMGLLQDLIAAV